MRDRLPAPATKNVIRIPAGSAPQKLICVAPRFPRNSIKSHVAGNEPITTTKNSTISAPTIRPPFRLAEYGTGSAPLRGGNTHVSGVVVRVQAADLGTRTARGR